ncbi:MAG: imidazoleglycerol-phosphate dehydratase HisB [Deltaproteobacteria bacterium]|nr:imidazoleglycerol-phosphate dehydratase HisB [Deltaproteobacteria bacterium]
MTNAPRKAEVTRKTTETDIAVSVNLDESGESRIATGVGFFDHMLAQVARHGRIGLVVAAKGDLHIDAHHTVEDVGLALGQALAQAIGNKAGIERYGEARVPMMECLGEAVIDWCNRPFLVYDAALDGKLGDMDAELVEEFFRSVATTAGFTLHLTLVRGGNRHHGAEALFKAFAVALRRAAARTGEGVPSTKGAL